ncbi:hypothetical protein HYR99_40250 [Candidatus Poribacteria bacterium]|nr:hypothetical protein [Candidatus Poribacteria bacterium]
MAKKVLTLAALMGFFIGIASLVGPHLATAQQSKKDPQNFKRASEPDEKLKQDMLKSREYQQIYREIKATGRKGPAAARERLRVYPKEAVASEITINERNPQGSITRQIQVGVVSVDSGGDVQSQPTSVGIIMVGVNGKYKALRLTGEIGQEGKPTGSLVDMKGKSIYESPLTILEKPHLKIKPNGSAIATDGDEVLILISGKRRGENYAIVVPSVCGTSRSPQFIFRRIQSITTHLRFVGNQG